MDIIRKLRREKGINQEALAAAMQVSRSAIAMWETGASRPRPNSLKKLADFFGVTTDYLLGITPRRTHGEPAEDAEAFALGLRLPEEEAAETDGFRF